jgi:endonuclease/exonuclease/phosphatase family metal-dependent hydrolase
MSIRLLPFVALVALVFAAACGNNTAPDTKPRPTPVAQPTPYTPGYSTDPKGQDPPTDFKVAFINLLSPVTVDEDNPTTAETFDMRLEIIIEELRAIQPDIVGFNEVSWTKDLGSAAEKLAKALKMELQYVRANPWFPGQSQELSDQTVKLTGFEEGELILTKHPILRARTARLNPRTSETEGRAALHVVVKGHGSIGEIDVYITHLTGGADRVRLAQAENFAQFVKDTRGDGPILIMGGFGSPPESDIHQVLINLGVEDVAAAEVENGPLLTCCRETIVGEQPEVSGRTDYIFAAGWSVKSVSTFGLVPRKRADDMLVYASDHNGLLAVFEPLPAAPMP